MEKLENGKFAAKARVKELTKYGSGLLMEFRGKLKEGDIVEGTYDPSKGIFDFNWDTYGGMLVTGENAELVDDSGEPIKEIPTEKK